MSNIKCYKSIIFDCDGVVLNSNSIKTNAFYKTALPYGEEKAQALVKFHVENGGISRYAKFEYFLKAILHTDDFGCLESLVRTYADFVYQDLLTVQVAEGLKGCREKTIHANWLIVSGGDQSELRAVFHDRGLDDLFDGGIFGSPCTKTEILQRELSLGTIKRPALFLGDSRYDELVAKEAGFDFVFVSAWTESDYTFPKADFRVKFVKNLFESN